MAPCSPVVSDQPAFWHLDAARGPSTPSLDHLVGALLDMQRYVESKRFRGLEIDDQLNPGREFDRQISRLCTLQDLVNVDCSVPKVLALINAVACEPSDLDTVALCKDRRQPCAESKLNDVRTLDLEQPVHWDDEGLSLPIRQSVECGSQVVTRRGFLSQHCDAAGTRGSENILHEELHGSARGVGKKADPDRSRSDL